MDLSNLENYPVYILNVVPELSEEGNIQIPQQLNSSDPLSYSYFVPNIEQQVPILSSEIGPSIVSHKKITKSIKKSYEKNVQRTPADSNLNVKLVSIKL